MFERLQNKRIELIILLIMILIYEFTLVYMILEALQNQNKTISITIIVLMACFAGRHILLKNQIKLFGQISGLLIGLELLLMNLLYYVNFTKMIEPLYIVFVADILVCYKRNFSISLAYIGYGIYIVLRTIKGEISWYQEELIAFIIDSFNFSLLIFGITFAKIYIQRNNQLKVLMEELQMKNEQLKQMAILMERERIAGEMHDTVGHTLTTTIVEIEASKMLLKTKPEVAMEKLTSAGEQVKKGLHELRLAIKRIDSGEMDFQSQLKQMVQEVMIHTSVQVELDIEIHQELLPIQQRVLLLMIQESLTNSLKHGNALEILISIQQTHLYTIVTVADNGRGCESLTLGYGLNKMTDRVKGLGGIIDFRFGAEGGFTTIVKLPFSRTSEVRI